MGGAHSHNSLNDSGVNLPEATNFRDLPFFHLEGKRGHLRYINTFERPLFATNELLRGHYEDRIHATFRLAPITFVQVTANVRTHSDGQGFQGSAVCEYNNHSNLHASAMLATQPTEHVEGNIRYSDRQFLPKGLTLIGGVQQQFKHLTDSLPIVAIGANYKYKPITIEAIISSDNRVGGWTVLKHKDSGAQLGIRAGYRTDLGQVEIFDIYTAFKKTIHFERRERGTKVSPHGPNRYQFVLGLNDMGNTFVASFYQHIKLGSLTTGYNHHVALGGEFQHNTGKNLTASTAPLGSVMTVGGSWQVTNRSLVKARFSTAGNVDALFAFKIGYSPMLTVTANYGFNVNNGEGKKGFSILFED